MATLSALVAETTTIKNTLTTCHTNLKTKLTNKGVSVSSTDKLSTLINKIDNLSSATGDNVIAATKLPSTGKDGQICIVTEVAHGTIYVGREKPTLQNNDIWIKPTTSSSYTLQTIKVGNKSFNFRVHEVIQKVSNVEKEVFAWRWLNGAWDRIIPIPPPRLELITSKGIDTNATGGVNTYTIGGEAGYGSSKVVSTGNVYAMAASSTSITTGTASAVSKKPIDLTNYSSLVIKYSYSTYMDWDMGSYYSRYGVGFDLSSDTKNYNVAIGITGSYTTTGEYDSPTYTRTIDISSFKGNYYLKFFAQAFYWMARINIHELYLEQ